MITVLLLNYKRRNNIDIILDSLKSQTLNCEIFLWNNSSKIFTDNRVDWIINSSKNQFCWPRWFMGVYANNDFIMSMDDDITFTHNSALEELYNEAIKYREKGRAIGIEGVRIQNFNSYFSTRKQMRLNKLHIGNPNLHFITPKKIEKVDIIKGRLLLCVKEDLKEVPINTKFREFGDDIAMSFFLSKGKKEHHIVTNKLNGKVKNLWGINGLMAQQSKENWGQIRLNVLNEYFNTTSGNDNNACAT